MLYIWERRVNNMSMYLDKIKAISKINISGICKELKINRSNLLNGRTTEENEKIVCEKLVEEFKKVI